jgi:molecular chaperone GrpE
LQQEDIKNTTTEETSANEQEVREEATAEETTEAAEEKVEVVDERDEKITELNNRLMRLQADFDNFRRRTQGEKEQLSGFVTAGVVGKFLKVLDNFEELKLVQKKLLIWKAF